MLLKNKNNKTTLAAGEKNFWRRNKLKRRNQSVSVAQADQSGIVVHDEDDNNYVQDSLDMNQWDEEKNINQNSIDVSIDNNNLYTDFQVTPAQRSILNNGDNS